MAKDKEMAEKAGEKSGFLDSLASRGLFMRLLMFSMLGMGLATGGFFLLFAVAVLGLPEEIVFQRGFVLACLAAGLLVGILNFLLVRILLGAVLKRLAASAGRLARGDLS